MDEPSNRNGRNGSRPIFMKRDLLESIGLDASPLELAAKAVLRGELDRVEVHPCDEGDDVVAARHLTQEMKILLSALTGYKLSK
ncbi:TPA: hypothetical protein OXB29_004898 [Escherichia coli]|nr:hypothetical protein [Escherichia coli]HBX6771998.1 hypothetical protein [Klebsiella pneumoniae]HBB3211159.1 hypothetical protein [Escherichia coli]HBX6778366.1 hypothetical protein [Klebsiella pneumoniae]HCW2751476.1 hypothetical protein [Escherichia coli]